ncbi:MAG: peptide-methionine (S)-S-oxide reductase [Crocinitomicaceae bacterium]
MTTTLEPFSTFYPAEAYHQDFEKRNPDYPYVKQVSIPRLKAFKNKTKDLLKKKP